jgi:hypothetical protein
LVEEEQSCFNNFAEENPEVLLPSNIDVENGNAEVLVNEAELEEIVQTTKGPIKEPENSPSWTEVVRRGKTRSMSNKMCSNDRRILEY